MSETSYQGAVYGEDIDAAVSLIKESKLTATQLATIIEVVKGEAKAEKVLLLNAQLNISGINILGASILNGNRILFNNLTQDPASPEAGKLLFYSVANELRTKSSDGTVTIIGAVKEKDFTFTSKSSVVCQHDFGIQFPSVIIVSNTTPPVPLKGDIFYTDKTKLTVTFDAEYSGKIIVKKS